MGNILQNITSVSPCDLTPAGDFTLPYSDTPIQSKLSQLRPAIAHILQRALEGKMLNHEEAEALFYCQGPETDALLHTADIVRELRTGNDASFVITRNINFTNVCHMGCQFCNFGVNKNAGDAEFLAPHQVAARAKEAHARGAKVVYVDLPCLPQARQPRLSARLPLRPSPRQGPRVASLAGLSQSPGCADAFPQWS